MIPQQPPADTAAPTPDIRAIIAQLQQSGQFDQLSTAQLESLLSQLKGEKIEAKPVPGGNGLSLQNEDGRHIAANPDRTAVTGDQERASLAEIFQAMRSK